MGRIQSSDVAPRTARVRRARPDRITRLARRFARSLRLGGQAAYRGMIEFYNSDSLTFASSIAYYALLSMFPFILLLITLAGRFSSGENSANNQMILMVVLGALPSHFDFVASQIAALAKAPPALGVAGTILMIWAAMGFFSAITSAVNHAWGVEKPHNYFKHKLIAAVMLGLAALLMVATLSLVGFLEVTETQWFSSILQRYPGLERYRGWALRNAPMPLFVLVCGLVCYFLPNAKVRLRDVWWGAIIAGGLWRLAFYGFSLYVRDVSRFTVHGPISTVVVFLVWVYISAVILLYGVEVSASYARVRKHLPQEAPAAAVRET
jgi:membrane protein